jgi:hypothetical protein
VEGTGVGSSVRFDGVLGGTGNKARIYIEPDVTERLGAGPTPDVDVTVNGFTYRSAVRFQHGHYFVSHTIAERKLSGLAIGDRIDVQLAVSG